MRETVKPAMEYCSKCLVTHWVGGECPDRSIEPGTLAALEAELAAIPGEIETLDKLSLSDLGGQTLGEVLSMIEQRRARENSLRFQIWSLTRDKLKGEIEEERRLLKILAADLDQAAAELADAEAEDSRIKLGVARSKLDALIKQRSSLNRSISTKQNQLGEMLNVRPTI